MKKKLLIPVGITVAAAIGCAAAVLTNKPAGGSTAYVYQDGKEIARLPLDGSADGKTVTISGENGSENIVEVVKGKVHMKSATCKDQLCVKMGWRDRPDTPIVCLPNKVVIDVKENSNEQDTE